MKLAERSCHSLWTLKTIDSLPNPDPCVRPPRAGNDANDCVSSDIAPLDDKPSDPKMIQIDDAIEYVLRLFSKMRRS